MKGLEDVNAAIRHRPTSKVGFHVTKTGYL